jgi:hypothetical protein
MRVQARGPTGALLAPGRRLYPQIGGTGRLLGAGADRRQVSVIVRARWATLPKTSRNRTDPGLEGPSLVQGLPDLALLPGLARPQLERRAPAGRDGRGGTAEPESVTALVDVAGGGDRDDLVGAGLELDDDVLALRLDAARRVDEHVVDAAGAGRARGGEHQDRDRGRDDQ